MGGNLCKTHLIKNLYPEHTKNSQNNSKKMDEPFKKWAKDLKRHFTKEDPQITNEALEKCSTPLVIEEMQIKITRRHHYIAVRKAKM